VAFIFACHAAWAINNIKRFLIFYVKLPFCQSSRAFPQIGRFWKNVAQQYALPWHRPGYSREIVCSNNFGHMAFHVEQLSARLFSN